MESNLQEIQEYVNKNKVNNNDIKKSIDIVKNKIKTSKITNKKEVIDRIDNTYFLIDKGDKISREMFKQASQENKIDTKCFVVFFDNMNPIIFLSKDAEIMDITHELNHIVEKYMNQNILNIERMFNFSYNFKEYSKIYELITNGNFLLTKSIDRNTLNYLKNPSEIYARIDNLKHFLYEYNFLKTPNQDIDKNLTKMLFTGEIFNNLPNNDIKRQFVNSDFMQILMFFDVRKYPEINKLVKQKMNENNDPIGSYPIENGPSYNVDIIYNPPMFNTNISSNSMDTIKDFKRDFIEDDYFKDINRNRKKKRKIKKFTEYTKEGAGFGNVDYRNVTGNATTSGYLNDTQPLGNNGSSTISSDLPRGNWYEPTTILIGFKDYVFKDPYFLKRKDKKKRKNRNFEDDIRYKKSNMLNKKYKKELPEDD